MHEESEVKENQLEGLTKKIASMLEVIDKSSRKELDLSEIASHLKEFQVALDGASIELPYLRSNDPHRNEYKQQLRDHKTTLKNFRHEYDQKKSNARRSELLGEEDRETAEGLMKYGSSIQEKSKPVLKNTLNIIHDIIQVGVDTMGKLEANKAQMEEMYDKLESIESTLTRSTRMIKRIARKIATDKYVWIVVALVFIATVFIIVWKNVKKS